MKALALIILASGQSLRFNKSVSKMFIRLQSTPLWAWVAKDLARKYPFLEVIIACQNPKYFAKFAPSFTYVKGSNSRSKSLENALKITNCEFVLVSDAARVRVNEQTIKELISVQKSTNADCVSPILRINDSVMYEEGFINRDKIKLIYTPQLSRKSLLLKGLKMGEYSDDSAAVAAAGGTLAYIKANEKSRKLTYWDDLFKLDLPSLEQEFFTGCGYDVHAFGVKRPLVLGGVVVHESKGVIAHSDGDVLIHALIDALLGAAGLGDIGEHFPDNDEAYKNASSVKLLQDAYKLVLKYGFVLVNADICVIMQSIKLGGKKEEIAKSLSKILGNTNINIKATTTEGLGFVGRDEGVAVMANVSLKYFDWMKNEDIDN